MINIIQYIQPIQLIAGIILLVLATYVSQHHELKLTRGMFLFFLLTATWSLCAAAMLQVLSLEDKIFLNRIKMVAAVCIAPSVLQIALDFNKSFKFSNLIKKFALITSLFFVLIMISPWHDLLITNYKIIRISNLAFLRFDNGPLFIIHNILSRVYVLAALVFLIQSSFTTNYFYKKTAWSLIISILVPFLIDSTGVFFLPEIRYLQLVPVALTFTSIIMVLTLLKHKSINIMPIARSTIFNSLSGPCLVWNSDGDLVDLNESAQNLFNVPQNLNDAPRFDEFKKENFLYFDQKDIFKTKHGKIITDAVEIGSYSIFENITDSYNNSIVKTNLMSVLSHDIRGHVGQLGFLSETLYFDQDKINQEEVKSLIEGIYLTSQDLNFFLGDVIHWSRDQYNGWKIKNESVNLKILVMSVCDYVNSLSKVKEIKIVNHIDSNYFFSSDPAMLEIVIRNLIYNAIKHSPFKSEVVIQLSKKGLVIKNQGLLININQLNSYFKGAQESSLATSSEGLGHRICKEFLIPLKMELQYTQVNNIICAEIDFNQSKNSEGHK